jgi:hypothetical protein
MSYYVIGGGAASGLGQDMLGRQPTVYRAGGGSPIVKGGAQRVAKTSGIRQRKASITRWQPSPGGRHLRHGVHGIFDTGDVDPYVALIRRQVGTRGLSGLMGAFGAADPNAVCSDWMAGGACTDPNDASCASARAAGGRAATAIQQALNDQGYGPIAVDGIFGDNSIAAWNRFADKNPGTAHDWPDCAGITMLMGGGGVKGTGAPSKAGVAFGILAAGLVALGALALLSKKKKGAHHRGHGETITIREGRS